MYALMLHVIPCEISASAALLLPGLASAAGLITSSAVGPIANTIQAFWAGSALVVLANAGHKVVFNNTFSTIDLFHLAIALFDGYSVILPLSTVAMLLVIVLSQAISITTDHPSMLNLLKAMYDKVQSYFADNKNDDTCRKVRVLGKLGMAALSTDFLSVIAAPKRAFRLNGTILGAVVNVARNVSNTDVEGGDAISMAIRFSQSAIFEGFLYLIDNQLSFVGDQIRDFIRNHGCQWDDIGDNFANEMWDWVKPLLDTIEPDGDAPSTIIRQAWTYASPYVARVLKMSFARAVKFIFEKKVEELIPCLSRLEKERVPGMDQTVVHVACSQGDVDAAVLLLANGYSESAADANGDTPLHYAVKNQHADIVRLLLCTGADHRKRNFAGVCALDVDSSVEIVDILQQIENYRVWLDEQKERLKGARTGFAQKRYRRLARLLSLDGGGIRGIVTIIMLMELEELLGEPVMKKVDFVAGTSTGGILAAALTKYPPKECLFLYLKLKDAVFRGIKPYIADALELFLKNHFGERALMRDLTGPRMVITASSTKHSTCELVLFRNYRTSNTTIEEMQPTVHEVLRYTR
ncbi:Patatin-like phospholipase family protein [Aphelenchoides avenae]|nr:Patatin-like phospholipase family protein [Aphelenchus avenae]